MMIAHLPAGYLAGRTALNAGVPALAYWGVLLGSFAPDFDMLWFLFVDHGSVHHHSYLTHRPAVWAVILAVGLATRSNFLAGLGAGGLLHLTLDTTVGKINWGWPIADVETTLVHVPATHDHWVLSFIFHWTFAVEIGICLIAGLVFLRKGIRP